jgi:hypothetical protein
MILKSESCHAVRWMQIRLENSEALALERIDDFLQATARIVDRGHPGGAGVFHLAAEGARQGAIPAQQAERAEHAAGYALDPALSRRWRDCRAEQFTAAISGQIYG